MSDPRLVRESADRDFFLSVVAGFVVGAATTLLLLSIFR